MKGGIMDQSTWFWFTVILIGGVITFGWLGSKAIEWWVKKQPTYSVRYTWIDKNGQIKTAIEGPFWDLDFAIKVRQDILENPEEYRLVRNSADILVNQR